MKQFGELTVAEYMTDQPLVVNENEKLTHAIRIMDEHRLAVLPVVDNENNVVGILSTSDLIQITHEIQSDLSALPHVNESTQNFLIKLLIDQGDSTFVRDTMTTPVQTVPKSTNLVVAAKMLAEREYHHLPVIDDEGKPAGILSTFDFVRAFAERGALLAG